MKYLVIICLFLLAVTLVRADECTDAINRLEIEMQVMQQNINSHSDMGNNQTINAMQAQVAGIKADMMADNLQRERNIRAQVSSDTNPYKFDIGIVLGTIFSTATVLFLDSRLPR